MEIDKWGRRFYHRGGVAAPALDEKYQLRVDVAEGRPKREAFKMYNVEDREPEKEKLVEDAWKQIEYDLIFDSDKLGAEEEIVDESTAKGNSKHKIVTVEVASKLG